MQILTFLYILLLVVAHKDLCLNVNRLQKKNTRIRGRVTKYHVKIIYIKKNTTTFSGKTD